MHKNKQPRYSASYTMHFSVLFFQCIIHHFNVYSW